MLKIIPVPLFEDKYEEIAEHVIVANKMLGEAGDLENKAINLLETEIEMWSNNNDNNN